MPNIGNVSVYPPSPFNYVGGQNHQFNVTVNDADQTGDISTVILEWNGSNETITSYTTLNSTARNYYTTKSNLGIATYNYKWFVNDSADSWARTSSTYVVTSTLVTITLNETESWWNDPINVSIQTITGGSPVVNANVNISLNTTGGFVCSQTSATDANGRYSCAFNSPESVGNYNVSVSVYNPSDGQTNTNSTILKVKVSIGETKKEKAGAGAVGCYDVPMVMLNPDGSIKKVMVKTCVWK